MPKKKKTITKESGLFHEMQVRMDIIQKFMKLLNPITYKPMRMGKQTI